jgi:hypothetical protein
VFAVRYELKAYIMLRGTSGMLFWPQYERVQGHAREGAENRMKACAEPSVMTFIRNRAIYLQCKEEIREMSQGDRKNDVDTITNRTRRKKEKRDKYVNHIKRPRVLYIQS